MSNEEERQYLESEVKCVLTPLIAELLKEKPKDPVPAILEFLEKLKGVQPLTESELHDLKRYQNKERFLKNKLQKKRQMQEPTEEWKSDSIVTDSEDDSDDDTIASLPVPKKAADRKPRASVSAEAFGEWNKKEAFIPPVHEKNDQTREHLREVLSAIFMFQTLDDKEMDICINAMSKVDFNQGQHVIRFGEEGDCYYVVESGELDCGKTFKGQDEWTYFLTYKPGMAFGELALLYNAPRAADIIGKTSGSLWRLDRDTFNHIVKDSAVWRRNMYEAFLKKVPLLSSMDNYERVMISDAFKQHKFRKGEAVI